MFNNSLQPSAKKFVHIRERGRKVRNRTDFPNPKNVENSRGDYECEACGAPAYKPYCLKHIEKMPYLAQNAAMFAVFSLFPGI